MSIKHFCDRCGAEIPLQSDRLYLLTPLSKTSKENGWNVFPEKWAGHLCDPCTEDVVEFAKGNKSREQNKARAKEILGAVWEGRENPNA